MVCPSFGGIITVIGIKSSFATGKNSGIYNRIISVDFFRQITQFIKSAEVSFFEIYRTIGIPLFFWQPFISATIILLKVFSPPFISPKTLKIVSVYTGIDQPIVGYFLTDIKCLNMASFPFFNTTIFIPVIFFSNGFFLYQKVDFPIIFC